MKAIVTPLESTPHYLFNGTLLTTRVLITENTDNQKYGPHITKKGPAWDLTTRAKIYKLTGDTFLLHNQHDFLMQNNILV